MSEAGEFRRVAILGVGLIGASFGAALAKARPGISIVAYDRPEVLRKLRESKFDWETSEDLGHAVRDTDLIYVALPVGAVIEMLPEIASQCDSRALVTDAGSTKTRICKAAQKAFGDRGKFLGGHPIAGRELGGLESADAELFHGKRYALINDGWGKEGKTDSRVQQFVELLRATGAEPIWSDAETHDWAMAVVSQMPQLVAIAVARVVSDETDETGLPLSLAGSGLRDLLRTTGSPYEVWRDICMTNTENIAHSLDRAAQAIDFLRAHLTNRELEKEFAGANEVYKMLREMDLALDGDARRAGEPIPRAGADG
ncbi:MAG: prephenate dehydrogenase/arogenate dehydrogenase family protein [Candidatus Acidiferrales bacterium]